MQDLEFTRARSAEAARAQLEEAKAAAALIGLKLDAAGNRWLLRDDETGALLLVFWPATAKAQEPGRCAFRCRGFRHALRLLDGMLRRGRTH